MKHILNHKKLYGLSQYDFQNFEFDSCLLENINALSSRFNYPSSLTDVFLVMLQIIRLKNWEGVCHTSASILYVIYKELGFNVNLLMGEVKIDHRYFDHSWIEIDGLVVDASLISPINKNLGLSPVFLNTNLITNAFTTLEYGAVSSMGLSDFTEIIYQRPFHKYMNPFPWGKGKWNYVELISNVLDLNIDIRELNHKYRSVERTLIR